MTKQRRLAYKTVAAFSTAAICFLLLGGLTASFGADVAFWDFEDGTAGTPFTDTAGGAANGSGGSVDTVNSILMRGWNDYYGPSWTNAKTSNSASTLAMRNADNHQDGYVTEGALHNWSPTAWTFETAVYLDDVSGWNTLIGRDGSSQAEPASDFYLTNNGVDDRFRINIDTVGGERWILDGDTIGEANKWYGVAATSDGVTLSLYLNDGSGYQLDGSLDMSAQSVADNALPGSALNWTFGRGWYNGAFVDHIAGYMDNIRISDVALAVGDLLPVEAEPASMIVEVNETTGEVILRNISDAPITFDYYLIQSGGGALDPAGWDSLDDQGYDAGLPADFDGSGGPVDGADLAQWESDFTENGNSDANHDGQSDGLDLLIWQNQFGQSPGPGDSWDEAGGSNSNQLAELYLNDATTLDPAESVSLGFAYDPSVLGAGFGDLTLKIGLAGGALENGGISYVSGAVATAVPEPATAVLTLVVALGACARGRRRV